MLDEEKKAYGVIYKITNIVNNKIYIGQTKQLNGFNDRYKGNGTDIERVYNHYLHSIQYNDYYNKHLYNSIKKYGFDNFEVNKTFDVAYSKEELNEKEQYWIKHYKSFDNNYGYNYTMGGDGNDFTPDSYKNNMGIGKRYRPFICVETKDTFLTIDEAVQKYKVNRESLKRVLKGKQQTTYSKLHEKKIHFRYITISSGARKPVICLNNQQYFLTLTEARDWCHLKNNCGITDCCNGVRQSAGKHPLTGEKLRWMYAIDYKLHNK